jgi:ribonuclease HI
MLLFEVDDTEAQEWEIVQRVVQASVEAHLATWEALARCVALEAYTDGSAPVRNPGGPAGFATVLVGFDKKVSRATPKRPDPVARIDLGGYIPQRNAPPLTSNNRAEIAGVMAAQEALRHLSSLGSWAAQQVIIWSDSKYAVMCANGTWKRKKNTDLWPLCDRLAAQVGRAVPGGVTLEWVKGHAGNLYNEAADHLATEAAFNFDEAKYARFRAAQVATGREMPGEGAIASQDRLAKFPTVDEPVTSTSSTAPAQSQSGGATWLNGADYALVLHTRMDAKQQSAGTGIGTGTYRIWAKDGRSRDAEVRHRGQMLHDEAEYFTLISALSGMVERITARGSDPGDYVLTVYSGRELVVKQLAGEYRVKAVALQAPYADAQSLLKKFKRVEVIWKRGPELTAMLKEAPIT